MKIEENSAVLKENSISGGHIRTFQPRLYSVVLDRIARRTSAVTLGCASFAWARARIVGIGARTADVSRTSPWARRTYGAAEAFPYTITICPGGMGGAYQPDCRPRRQPCCSHVDRRPTSDRGAPCKHFLKDQS